MAHSQQNHQTLKLNPFNERLAQVAGEVEETLNQILQQPTTRLHEAMRYSVLGGGKRLRSYVLYEAASLFNVPLNQVLQVAPQSS